MNFMCILELEVNFKSRVFWNNSEVFSDGLYGGGNGEAAGGVAASTLRYYDKEGLLPFVERSSGGIRMFRESDIEWLQVIGCMKKAGMSIKDIRQYIEMALQGDDTIDLRLAMFRRQQEALKQQMAELQHTMEMVDYKCWYYETAKEAGTVDAPQKMELAEVPERFRKIRQELRTAPGTAATI